MEELEKKVIAAIIKQVDLLDKDGVSPSEINATLQKIEILSKTLAVVVLGY